MEISKAYYTIFKYDALVDLQVLVKLLEEFNVIKVDNLPKMLLLHFMLLKCMHICLHVCIAYEYMCLCRQEKGEGSPGASVPCGTVLSSMGGRD